MFAALIAAGALSVVDSAARELRFHGVVRVERDGKVLVDKGYGLRAGTTFWVASISKSFTAALIVSRLQLDDRIGDLRIDELLTHTSGLPRSTYLVEGISDREEAKRLILAQPRGEKGRFAYTNEGYSLLAIAAEEKLGAPFFDLLQREVLDRAGLSHTGFWPRCVPGARIAKLRRPPRGPRARENWGFKGAEGVCSTAADLSRFMHAIGDGTLPGRDLLWTKAASLSGGFAGRGFFVEAGWTIWTRGTEDYGHNGVVKWFPGERLLVIALSDVPERRRDVPAPSRAMGDLLEWRRNELR